MGILVIGHRGAKGYEPENTLRSFKKAIDAGVDVIELDVRLSKDRELIVIHDDKVDRTTDGLGFVRDLSLAELKKFDAGNGEKIPTLQEVFDLVKKIKRKVITNIETKEKGLEKKLVESIEKNYMVENVVVSSFMHSTVKNVKEINPKIKIGLLYAHPLSDAVKVALRAKAEYLIPNIRIIDRKTVEEAHRNGIKVIVWNADNEKDVKKMVKLGVDGIASNKPDIVINTIKKIED